MVPVVAKREKGEARGGDVGQLWGEGAHQAVAADVEECEAAKVGAKDPEFRPRGWYGAADVIVRESQRMHIPHPRTPCLGERATEVVVVPSVRGVGLVGR